MFLIHIQIGNLCFKGLSSKGMVGFVANGELGKEGPRFTWKAASGCSLT